MCKVKFLYKSNRMLVSLTAWPIWFIFTLKQLSGSGKEKIYNDFWKGNLNPPKMKSPNEKYHQTPPKKFCCFFKLKLLVVLTLLVCPNRSRFNKTYNSIKDHFLQYFGDQYNLQSLPPCLEQKNHLSLNKDTLIIWIQ